LLAQAALPAISEASEVLGLRLKAVDKKSEKAVLAQVCVWMCMCVFGWVGGVRWRVGACTVWLG